MSDRPHRHLHCPIDGCEWYSNGAIYDDEHRATIPLPLSVEFMLHVWTGHNEAVTSVVAPEYRLTAEEVQQAFDEDPFGFIASVVDYNRTMYGQDEAPLNIGSYN